MTRQKLRIEKKVSIYRISNLRITSKSNFLTLDISEMIVMIVRIILLKVINTSFYK